MGYWRSFTAKRDTVVGISCFGYGDGYLEDLGKKGGYVLIHGKRAPIISVCMDQTFLDITDIPAAEIGDTVTLIWKSLRKTPMLSTSAISANAR